MKKLSAIILALILCFGITACGGSSGSSGGEGASMTVGDVSFTAPADYEMTVDEESGNAEYFDDTFMIGVYVDTDDTAPNYNYDPPAANVEELYDCFVNKNPDVTDKEKIDISGTEAYILTYDSSQKDAVFLHNDKMYCVSIWSDGGLTNAQEKAFDALVGSVALN